MKNTLLEQAVTFMRHGVSCRWNEKGYGPCNCGRDSLLKKIQEVVPMECARGHHPGTWTCPDCTKERFSAELAALKAEIARLHADVAAGRDEGLELAAQVVEAALGAGDARIRAKFAAAIRRAKMGEGT